MNQSIVTTLLLVPVDTGFVSSYSCVMRTAKPRGVNGLSREQVLGAMCVCVFRGGEFSEGSTDSAVVLAV